MKKFLITLYGRRFIKNVIAYLVHKKFNLRTCYNRQELSDSLEFLDILKNSEYQSSTELDIFIIDLFNRRYKVETKEILDASSFYMCSDIARWIEDNLNTIISCIDRLLENCTKNEHTINELGLIFLGSLRHDLKINNQSKEDSE